jgi:hypothetical protein
MLAAARMLLRRSVRLDKVLLITLAAGVGAVILNTQFAFHAANAKVSSTDIGLSKLIMQLRSELETMEQQRAAHQQEAILRIKNVDLELNFVVKVDQHNKNELRFEAVTVGADQGMSLERSNKITLHMEIAAPEWVNVIPTQLSEGNTKELPSRPLKKSE